MKRVFIVAAMTIVAAALGFAQGLPTSQPNLIQIIREGVKVGHEFDHVRTEAGWPAAFAKAKSPTYYLALASLTGSPEVWFVIPYDSHAALGDSMKRESDDPVLSVELPRLSRADAEHVSDVRTIHAMARKDLSRGAFPDTSKQRFYEITLFRVRPGHTPDFEAAAKAYGAAAGRIAPDASFRVYQLSAGMPGPSFLVFSSVRSFAEFDKMSAAGQEIMKGLTSQEQTTLQKFGAEGMVNQESNWFRLDPEMSYVPPEVREQDPDFWKSKKPAAKPAAKPASKPTQP